MRLSTLICVATVGAALGACANVNAAVKDQSYPLGRGIASYDELARAGETCRARGGVVRPTGQGDTTMLSNYYCSIPAGAKAP